MLSPSSPRAARRRWPSRLAALAQACSNWRARSGRCVPRGLCRAAWRRCVGDPCLPDEVEDRDQDAETRNRPDPCAASPPEGDMAMTDDSREIVRGSGNVFRDFGYPDADVRQAKALLAAQITKVLDAEQLTTRQAEARTGVAHSEFVRIRTLNLARFTMGRLVTILGRLDHEVEFSFTVHPRAPRGAKPETAHL